MTMPKKILVIDDDIDLLDHITLILKTDGYEVVQAQGQEEGEAAIRSTTPDLAIIDLMMENMDSGFVLCHQIKRLHPETPVIILTAVKSATGLDFSAKSSDAASWIKADLLLDKPVRPEQLRNEVKRLIA